MKIVKLFKSVAVALVASMAFVGQSAMAAIVATDLTGIGTSITTDADTIFVWVLPIIGTILGLTIGLKLLKKFTAKI